MSSPAQAAALRDSGKKAVHVKWAGKTIALGTFPAAEADEKCARAKALTRAWRSTMRPKPSRDWVMLELERLGVRVVSGRLGRKSGEDGDEDESEAPKKQSVAPVQSMGGMMDRSASLGWGNSDAELSTLMGRRNSSLGLSMLNDGRRGSLGSLGAGVGLDPNDVAMPPHRPLVGGGAAAAYEAARHDHFAQKSAEQQRRASSLGLGTLGGGLGNMGMSVNPNQHYEMLKLHHMNLLNEIQETTLMMNLYQQQQLQQQQQQLQQQASAGVDPSMASMLGGGGLDMFSQRASLGLGGPQLGGAGFDHQQLQMLQQQQQLLQGAQAGGIGSVPGSMNHQQDSVQGGGKGQPSVESRVAEGSKVPTSEEDPVEADAAEEESKKRPASDEGEADVKEKRIKSEEEEEEEPPSEKDDDKTDE